MERRSALLTVFVFLALTLAGCGSDQGTDASGGSRPTAGGGVAPAGRDDHVDCPRFLTTEQVTKAMGRPMRVNMAAINQLGTVCEWVANDDTSIAVSFRTYEGEDVAEFESSIGGLSAVAGFGDAAFQRPATGMFPAGTLYVRSGDLRFEIDAWDTNMRSGLDAEAVRGALARIVLGTTK